MMKPSDIPQDILEFIVLGDSAMKTYRALNDVLWEDARLCIVWKDGTLKVTDFGSSSEDEETEHFFEDGKEAIRFMIQRYAEKLAQVRNINGL